MGSKRVVAAATRLVSGAWDRLLNVWWESDQERGRLLWNACAQSSPDAALELLKTWSPSRARDAARAFAAQVRFSDMSGSI